MLLEDERTGECRAVALAANSTVYVLAILPIVTVNAGDEPLVYWGILSSACNMTTEPSASAISAKVIVEKDGRPVVMDRDEFLRELESPINHDGLRDETILRREAGGRPHRSALGLLQTVRLQ